MDTDKRVDSAQEKEYFRIPVDDLARIGQCRFAIKLLSHLMSEDMLEELKQDLGDDVLYAIASNMRIVAEEIDRLTRDLPFDDCQDKAA